MTLGESDTNTNDLPDAAAPQGVKSKLEVDAADDNASAEPPLKKTKPNEPKEEEESVEKANETAEKPAEEKVENDKHSSSSPSKVSESNEKSSEVPSEEKNGAVSEADLSKSEGAEVNKANVDEQKEVETTPVESKTE